MARGPSSSSAAMQNMHQSGKPNSRLEFIRLLQQKDFSQLLLETNRLHDHVDNIDGEMQPTTRDFRPGRINASVIDGIVTEFSIEGEEEESNDEVSENTQTPTDYIGMPVVNAAELAEQK